MDIINCIIIYDTSKYTIDEIKEDLMQEGYRHNFYFFRGDFEFDKKIMSQADEIWQFGECIGDSLLNYAREVGMEIWRMG